MYSYVYPPWKRGIIFESPLDKVVFKTEEGKLKTDIALSGDNDSAAVLKRLEYFPYNLWTAAYCRQVGRKYGTGIT